MASDGTGQSLDEIGVRAVKCQERQDSTVEVLDLSRLGLLLSSGVGFLLLCEALRGSFGV
jgi:hypothetical protein